LVVEDEEQVRRTTVEALRSLGYTVRHAADAREALAILETEPGVRLMLTDIVMPGMNGRMLAERVSRTYPQVRILLATGYDRDVDGADGHRILRKPFGIDQLARRVRCALDVAD
jgi:CheY-like chemotaxis protein